MSGGCVTAEGLAHCEEKLDALNKMTVTILAQNEGSHIASMSKVCGLLAETLDISGVSVWRHVQGGPGGDISRISQSFRWAGELGGAAEPPERFPPLSCAGAIPELESLLASGKELNGPVSSLPESSLFASFGCASLFISPLFFDNVYWGFAIYGDDRRERVFTKHEADVLCSAGYLLAASLRRHERTVRMLQADKGIQIMIDEMPLCCYLIDSERNMVDCNEQALIMFGAKDKREFIPRFWDCSPERQPDGLDSIEKSAIFLQKALNEGSCTFEWLHRGLDGNVIPVEIKAVKFRHENQDVVACYLKDLSNRQRLMRELEEAEKMTLAVTEASPIAYIQYDKDNNPLDCNAEALRLFGAPTKQLFLTCYRDRLMPELQPDGQNSAKRSLRLSEASEVGGRISFEWYYTTFGGEMFPTETSLTKIEYRGSVYIVAFIYDLRRTKKMEQSIMQLESEVSKIYFDPLTGLYNRRFLDENLRRVIKRLSRSDGVLSMMMVDIDHFKPYNDTYGHIAGDNCLKTIAEALRNTVARDGDFVARYGGEEFVVVLPNTDEEGVRGVAERMLENVRALALPHESSGAASFVTISIGAMTCKVKFIHSVNAYVHRADEIMYKSKRGGRNRYTFEYME